MSTTALNSKVLVVNQAWTPVNIMPAWDAINNVLNESADIVDENWALYSFEEWVESWSDAVTLSKIAEDQVINAVQFSFKAPEIIRLREYNKMPPNKPKCTRMGIFTRDGYTCQYCGKTKKAKELNIDHVHPKSRGGRATWENLVLSCIPCNNRKMDRTPSEANMNLLKEPKAPHWTVLKGKLLSKKSVPKSWEGILGKMYWNAAIDEE